MNKRDKLIQDIDKLSGFREVSKLFEKLDIPSDQDFTTVDDAKDFLLEYVKNAAETPQAQAILSKLLDDDKINRDKLCKLYIQTKDYVGRLPAGCTDNIEEVFPNFEKKLTDNYLKLMKNDCPILVAGEVSAGKSSLLNLILGEDILPTSVLSCTSVLTELRYSEKKRAEAYYWDDSKPCEKIDLEQKDTVQELSKYICEKDDRSKKFPYKHVKIYWPIPLLQMRDECVFEASTSEDMGYEHRSKLQGIKDSGCESGIFIVDSPGIGESPEMMDLVQEYLHSAFGFIYVINTPNAGGLQQDRLLKLLGVLCDQHNEYKLHPESAIFVCNKWDQVPEHDVDEVKKSIIGVLTKWWPGFEPSQVVYISTTKAAEKMQFDIMTTEFSILLKRIESLLPISLQSKLQAYSNWLRQIIHRSCLYLNSYIADATKKKKVPTATLR